VGPDREAEREQRDRDQRDRRAGGHVDVMAQVETADPGEHREARRERQDRDQS